MSEEHERTSDTERGETSTFKATAVCFTYNNPTIEADKLRDVFVAQGSDYLVFQREIAPDTGTPHFQGYAHFPRQRRFGPRFRGCFPEPIWLTAAKGSPAANRVYCTKEESRCEGPWEYGELPSGQGARTDLESFYREVTSGKRARHLLGEHYTVFARYSKFYNTIVSLSVPPVRTKAVQVFLSYGRTGVGKTRSVMACHGGSDELWRYPLGRGFWFDLYDGHRVALLDDFAGSATGFTLTALLQVLDREPCVVPVKGSHVWWYPDYIHITTNIHPSQWYDYTRREEQYSALMRRFTYIQVDLEVLDEGLRRDFEYWRAPPPAPLPPPNHTLPPEWSLSPYPGVHPNHGVWRPGRMPFESI